MKKFFLTLAVLVMALCASAQKNQYFWYQGNLMLGNPIAQIDSVTFGNEDTDSISLAHSVESISTSTTTSSLSTTSNGITFAVPTYTYDAAGHITSMSTNTYTMPNGFGKITGDSGTAEADCTYDSLALSGDSWISVIVSDKDSISFTH